MFGVLAFMLNDKMACGVIDTDLMVRVGPAAYADALAHDHVRPMDFTGRATRLRLRQRDRLRRAARRRILGRARSSEHRQSQRAAIRVTHAAQPRAAEPQARLVSQPGGAPTPDRAANAPWAA